MSSETLTAAKSTQMVGLADFKVSHDPMVTLSSLPLGSCLAVIIYEPTLKVAGVLHSLLPSAVADPARAATYPGMFLDSGLEAMIKKAAEFHVTRENLEIYVVGGAQVMDGANFFNIGQRHYDALTALLKKLELTIKAEDVGGRTNRSVQFDVDTGELRLKFSGQTELKTLCKR